MYTYFWSTLFLFSPSTYVIGASTYMQIYWLRKCNKQHKAEEEPFFASYWNSGNRKPRVTQGIAKQLSVYGIPRAYALFGNT
jgi:hypothetical protein